MAQYIRWFNELTMSDVESVGGKNASLGEMYQELKSEGIEIPNGFAITAQAYEEILTQNGAYEALQQKLDDLDPNDVVQLQKVGQQCREIIDLCSIPEAIEIQIKEGYEALKA